MSSSCSQGSAQYFLVYANPDFLAYLDLLRLDQFSLVQFGSANKTFFPHSRTVCLLGYMVQEVHFTANFQTSRLDKVQFSVVQFILLVESSLKSFRIVQVSLIQFGYLFRWWFVDLDEVRINQSQPGVRQFSLIRLFIWLVVFFCPDDSA